MTLYFDEITAFYGHKKVLDRVTFTAESGKITVLLGCNGAGKSTLIRCLTGEKQDYRGNILLDHHNAKNMDLHARALHMACLPQMLPHPHVTLWELLCFGRAPYTPLTGTLSEKDEAAVHWALKTVGMTHHRDSFVDTLSGGEQKKAFFAMTLAQDTPVVILDEPTAHLDTQSRFSFLTLLDALRQETEKTFLVVMHDLPEALRYADRIAVLDAGELIFTGTPGECLEAQIPQRYFHIQITGSRNTGYAVIPLESQER